MILITTFVFLKYIQYFFADYLDEDEKAFERLNSCRLYSSRVIDAETCKQQVRTLRKTHLLLVLIFKCVHDEFK